MGTMSQFVAPITSPLDDLQQIGQQLALQYHTSNDNVQQFVTTLVNGGKQDSFVGAGAAAFQSAMQGTSITLTACLQALNAAVAAHTACHDAVMQAADTVDRSCSNTYVLEQVLAQVDPKAVIDKGDDAVNPAIYAVGAQIVQQINAHESWLGHFIDGIAEVIQSILPTGELVGGDGLEYMGNVPSLLRQWAIDTYDAGMRWKLAMAEAQDVQHNQHVISDNAVPTNMSDLAQMINTQYGTSLPIGITMLANGTILVTLAGTEFSKWNQSNNGIAAGESGLGIANNAYEKDVMNAITSYMLEHHLQPGTNVVIAGHSLGGMVAQEIAAANGSTNFHVSDVVTFGSPQVGPPVTGVQYQEYFSQHDLVPLLSTYEGGRDMALGTLGNAVIPGLGTGLAIGGLSGILPGAKEAFTGETYVPDISHSWNPGVAHGAYFTPSTFLSNTPAPFSVNPGESDPTEYYGTTQQF
jgi:hypothetical protein